MGTNFFGIYENSQRDSFFDYSDLFQIETSEITSDNPVLANLKINDYYVTFDTVCKSYCIGCVDMVNSTKISAQLGDAKLSRYYQIFLNSMSKILCEYGGMVIKNIGDCLLYYFPSSSKTENNYGFMSCIECNLALVDVHDFICDQLNSEGLPCLNYRISSDYGSVCLMQPNNSMSVDMIGPSVNVCAKINRLASPNEIVIGGDLYEVVKSFKNYSFKKKESYSLGLKHSYPVYTVVRKNIGA